jgi:hypothetical protein
LVVWRSLAQTVSIMLRMDSAFYNAAAGGAGAFFSVTVRVDAAGGKTDRRHTRWRLNRYQ